MNKILVYILVCFSFCSFSQPSTIIKAYAGTGTSGYTGDGGPAALARMNAPKDVLVDQNGNVYVAEVSNSVIRKVTPAGIISTIAGNGTPGYSGNGGAATSAMLGGPAALVMDGNGNLLMAEQYNYTVRKIDSTGKIWHIAGIGGSPGYSGDGGPASSAQLDNPTGIAVDDTGNIYVADCFNHRIRKIDTLGIITTIAGTGTFGFSGDGGLATQAKLNRPNKLVIDHLGNIYVSDCNNHRIRKIAPTGIITTIAGVGSGTYGGDGGPAISADINQPHGLTFDADHNLYFVDYMNYRIRKIDTAGIITTFAGNGTAGSLGDGGSAVLAQFNLPTGIATDKQGHFYIADYNNHRVRKINYCASPITVNASGNTSICGGNSTVLMGSGATSYAWSSSLGPMTGSSVVTTPTITTTYTVLGSTLGCDASASITVTVNPVIGIAGPSTICVGSSASLSASGASSYTWNPGNLTGSSVVVAPYVATVYTVSAVNGSCQSNTLFTVSVSPCLNYGGVVAGNGSSGYSGDGGNATQAMLNFPYGIAKDLAGNLYIAERSNHRIRKVNPSGIISTFAGTGAFGFSGDGGPATSAMINEPWGVCTDNNGNVYIADRNSHRIRKVSPGGVITTIAGNGTGAYSGDGALAINASLNLPIDVEVDNAGNVYIVDGGNHAIRVVNTSGIINTLAGTGTAGFSGDGGPATLAQFNSPVKLAIDKSGNVFVSDCNNSRVRKINTSGLISTVAGIGYSNFLTGDGGPATSAAIGNIIGIAVDTLDNIYIANWYHGKIRKIFANGIIVDYTTQWINQYTYVDDIYCDPGGTALYYTSDGSDQVSKLMGCSGAGISISGTATVCPGGSTTLTATGAGSYVWTPGNSTSNPLVVTNINQPLNYVVTGGGACPSSTSVSLSLDSIPVNITASNDTVCTAGQVVLTANATGSGLTYTWSTGGTGSAMTDSPSGSTTYSVQVSNMNGCLNTDSIFIFALQGCVWPGDADENLIVDNQDILQIGLKFGQTGPSRSTISNAWQGYLASDWNDTLNNGKNTKYTDCDGDGSIGHNDTLAIGLNYGSTHPAKSGSPSVIHSSNSDIYVVPNKLQYVGGDTVFADIHVGSNSIPQSAFYGTTFSISYDNSKVQSGTETFWFTNSWVGSINQSMIKLANIDTGVGKVDVGLVRITHTDTSGFGKIGTLRFVLKNTQSAGTLYFTVSNGVKTNSSGVLSNLQSGTDSAVIVSGTTAISTIDGGLVVYPNPATNRITIQSPAAIGEVTISDVLGKVVTPLCPSDISPKGEKVVSFDISRLPAGVYMLQTKAWRAKFVKQ
jgi:sugar lactone lactonase YvrE